MFENSLNINTLYFTLKTFSFYLVNWIERNWEYATYLDTANYKYLFFSILFSFMSYFLVTCHKLIHLSAEENTVNRFQMYFERTMDGEHQFQRIAHLVKRITLVIVLKLYVVQRHWETVRCTRYFEQHQFTMVPEICFFLSVWIGFLWRLHIMQDLSLIHIL